MCLVNKLGAGERGTFMRKCILINYTVENGLMLVKRATVVEQSYQIHSALR